MHQGQQVKRFGFQHEKTWSKSDLVTVWLFGQQFELRWHWRDTVRTNSRAYVSLGWDRGGDHYGVLFQHYRQGFCFDAHTDGPASNHVLTLVLHRPKVGGEFFGKDVRRWFGGRVLAFDGAEEHGVTRIERGSRSVLMFQHGRWR
jgi:hypothetical protein